MSQESRVIFFHVPKNKVLLAALAEVTLRHTHLDRILQMTIKSLLGVTPREAVRATHRTGSRELRQRIGKLAKTIIGDGPELVKLQAILTECERLSDRRNDFTHSIWAKELDGGAVILGDDDKPKRVPTTREVKALAGAIADVTERLNEARTGGWLKDVIERRDAQRKG